MFEFFNPKHLKEELALIFCIESGKVISMIVNYTKKGRPEVIHVSRHEIEYSEHLNSSRLKPLMLSALKRALEHLSKEGYSTIKKHFGSITKIEKIYIFLGSPWHITEKLSTTVSEEKEFFIKEDTVSKATKDLFSKLHPNSTSIEQTVISVRANGYNIENPVGKRATTIEIDAHVALVENDLIDSIKEVSYLIFPNFKTEFHTIPMSLYVTSKSLFKIDDFMILIPEHEVSEMLLIRKRNLETSISLPYGKHLVVKHIAKEYNKSQEQAYSMLRLWSENKLEEKKSKSIETIIENARQEWSMCLRGAFSNLGKTILLPNTVLVAGNMIESRLLGEWLAQEQYTNQTFTVDKFSVLYLKVEDFSNQFLIKTDTTLMNPVLSSIVIYTKIL